MPELRKDPIIGRWVIIASERAKRPQDFSTTQEVSRSADFCPFCEGNEGKTPPESDAIRAEGTAPNTPGWRVRAVSNRYPALQSSGDLDKRGDGIYDAMNGVGVHEVIIETPWHELTLVALDDDHVADVLKLCRSRLQALRQEPHVVYGMLFKNVGAAAGASLEHTHSQIIGTPVIPRRVIEEMQGAKTFFDYRGRCIFCDLIRQDLGDGKRVVLESDRFVVLEPYASRFPFETCIFPRRHSALFDRLGDEELHDLATTLRETLRRIETLLDMPPYNVMLHTGALNAPESESYHWHIEIVPRLTKTAGFEWGTGFYINPVPPESAAAYLRDVAT